MHILFLGDVMGKGGRAVVRDRLPRLREQLAIDFVVTNGENAAHGRGLSPGNAEELFDAGVDVITLGDHAFDEPTIMLHLECEKRILRPLNIAPQAPGQGSRTFELDDGRKVLVINALGRTFMGWSYENPFPPVRELVEAHPLGLGGVDAIVIDFHAEATSEKNAMGHWCDGQASLVVGTHTHIPTNDARIMTGGTAYLTDAGMCGSYDSVIGSQVGEPLNRFVTGLQQGKLEPETRNPTMCGVFVVTDEKKGLATSVAPIRVGGVLPELVPDAPGDPVPVQ